MKHRAALIEAIRNGSVATWVQFKLHWRLLRDDLNIDSVKMFIRNFE